MGKRVLLVVNDPTPTGLAADASGQWMNDFLISLGHTVSPYAVANNAPASMDINYDLIHFGNSCPAATDLAVKGYNTSTLPRFACGVRSPHTGYANVGVTETVPTYTTQYFKTQGIGSPVVPSDLISAQSLTVLDNAFKARYTSNSALGSGHKQVMCLEQASLSSITYSLYDKDAQMSTGTAPARMAWWLIHPGSIANNVRGRDMMRMLVNWLTRAYIATAKRGNDSIISELKSQGFYEGTIMDRERARLLSLTNAPPGNTLADLYRIAGERSRF